MTNSTTDLLDWELSNDDEIALAARSVVADIGDPHQQAKSGAYYVAVTGCVRYDCNQELDLEDGWFCRPCRLYMTEIDDIDPVNHYSQYYFPAVAGNWTFIGDEGMLQSSPAIRMMDEWNESMNRIAEVINEGFDEGIVDIIDLLVDLPSANHWSSGGVAMFGVIVGDPEGEAIPCERCPLPAIEPRNRNERRHPRCTEHPLIDPTNPEPRSQQ